MSTRITVRLDDTLHARLRAFAQGRSAQGQYPDVSVVVREALEQYLAPKPRPTGKAQHKRLLSDSERAIGLVNVRRKNSEEVTDG